MFWQFFLPIGNNGLILVLAIAIGASMTVVNEKREKPLSMPEKIPKFCQHNRVL